MKKLDVIAEQLFNQIRSRFPSVEIGDVEGNVTTEPTQARFFEFDYEVNNNNLGKVSLSLDEQDGVVVMYSQNFLENQFGNVKTQWYNFLKEIRMFAKKRLMKFEVRDITKSNLTKRDYKFLATNRPGEQTMAESKMYGTNKTSYQKIGNARIAIKHKSPISTESSSNRTTNIGSIFIESPNGEKFKFPFKHLSGARAMARHVSEGGNAYDDFGKYISGLSEEMSKLRKFKQYMGRSTVMAESLAGYMDTVNQRISEVKKTVQNLQKESYYKQTFENFVAPEYKEVPDEVAENWIDQLTVKMFNEELKDVFPYIYNLVSETTKARELSFEDIMLDENEQYLTANPGETISDIVARAEQELGISTSADDVIEVNGFDDNPVFKQKTQVLIPSTSGAPTRSIRPQPRPETPIGAGGTRELGPNGQPTGSTRGIDPALNYNEAIENVFDEMMGQFGEGDKGKIDRNGDGKNDWEDVKLARMAAAAAAQDDEETKESKTPLGEFILSYFDRETGQFPKGPTAVLTMVEKEYGEQYVRPAQQFIERIDAKVAEVMGYREASVDEGFLRNLVGDVRNAFKPGVSVTPNMVKELEAGLEAIKAGGQPTPRQQKMMDTFMSETLPRELQKIGINIQRESKIFKLAKILEAKQDIYRLKQLSEAATPQDAEALTQAIKNFQTAAGLTADGIVGPQTKQAHKSALAGATAAQQPAQQQAQAQAPAQQQPAQQQAAQQPAQQQAVPTFPSMPAAMQMVNYYQPGERVNIAGQPHVRDVDAQGKKFFRPE